MCPDIESLVVDGEDAEKGVLEGTFGSVMAEDVLVVSHVVWQCREVHHSALVLLGHYQTSLGCPPGLKADWVLEQSKNEWRERRE
jgi:hypothetical protein